MGSRRNTPRRMASSGAKGRSPSGIGVHFRGHRDLDTTGVLSMARDEKESAGGPRMGSACTDVHDARMGVRVV